MTAFALSGSGVVEVSVNVRCWLLDRRQPLPAYSIGGDDRCGARNDGACSNMGGMKCGVTRAAQSGKNKRGGMMGGHNICGGLPSYFTGVL